MKRDVRRVRCWFPRRSVRRRARERGQALHVVLVARRVVAGQAADGRELAEHGRHLFWGSQRSGAIGTTILGPACVRTFSWGAARGARGVVESLSAAKRRATIGPRALAVNGVNTFLRLVLARTRLGRAARVVSEKAVDEESPDAASAPVKGRKAVRSGCFLLPASGKSLEGEREGPKNAVKALQHCLPRAVNQSGAVFGRLQNPCLAEQNRRWRGPSSASVPLQQLLDCKYQRP